MEFDNRAASSSSTLFSTPRQTSGAPTFARPRPELQQNFGSAQKKGLSSSRKKLIFIQMDEYVSPALDDVFAALAHPTRRQMLVLLENQGSKVTDLAARFDCSLNVASKHIQSLERAGLVRRERHGRVHRLSLDPAPLADAAAFIERYRVRWERQLGRLGNYLDRLAKERKTPPVKNSRKTHHDPDHPRSPHRPAVFPSGVSRLRGLDPT
jgi:DNA-binding transcriptional ArsR family regulator